MFAETAEKSELSHCSVSESSVLKHALDLFNSDRIIDILVPASLDDNRRSSITNYKL